MSAPTTVNDSTTETTDKPAKVVKPRGHARADLALLLIRLGLGVVMIAHGYQKVFINSVADTQAGFAQMGVPFADVTAVLLIVLEIGGGLAIIVGLLTPLVALLYALSMVGAVLMVHLSNGFFAAGGGYEFAAFLAVVSLALAVSGAGKLSLDRAFFGARRRRALAEAGEV